MQPRAPTTFLFTDIEGSTRLWEQDGARMRPALAEHDALARELVSAHGGVVVKMTGDGMHAAFADARGGLDTAIALQLGLAKIAGVHGLPLAVRCGLHAGTDEQRDNDFFGTAVNRAARVMSAAHGGQILVSQAVAALLADRLPPQVALDDLGAVRLRDLARPERVHQVVHPALRREFPPLRALESTPHNLPQPLTSFVGRERELAQARTLLHDARLVTLLGAGGIGKTRLSLQLAAELLDEFPDGAWFVDLAPLHDAALVPQAAAAVLKVHDDAGRGLAEVLAAHVRDRTLLVVLDNCEHVLAACAALAGLLLQAGPRVRVLASSREPLHLPGEACCPVPALSAPPPDADATVGDLARYEAVRLFLDRCRSVSPSFALTPANAPAIATICRRLDGIPLALELAAARVRALGVADIAARLDDRFALLQGRDRTALPRQQTLRALVDWSHDLLDEEERILFRRLAAFAGGWSLAAAEAVAGDGTLARSQVLDALARLTEKSLVARDDDAGRYHLLETIREYAQERLDAAGERAAFFDRHLAWCLALVEDLRAAWLGPRQASALARLDHERENLIAAHAWAATDPRNAEKGLRLVSMAKFYWINRGLLRLGVAMTVDALHRAEAAQVAEAARCRTLFDAGQLCTYMGRHAEARRYLDESLRIAREHGDGAQVAQALQPLCIAALGEGDHAMALRYAEESLALAEAQGDRAEIAYACNALAQVQRVRGALGAAEPLYQRALAIAREVRDAEGMAIAELNLAAVAIAGGRCAEARERLRRALGIVRDTRSQPAAQGLVEAAAALAACEAAPLVGARLLGHADAGLARTGMCRDPADEAALAPYAAAIRGALAQDVLARELAAGKDWSPEQALAEIEALLGGR